MNPEMQIVLYCLCPVCRSKDSWKEIERTALFHASVNNSVQWSRECDRWPLNGREGGSGGTRGVERGYGNGNRHITQLNRNP